MFKNNNRYNDYYLVNEEMEEIGFDERPKKLCSRRCKIIGITIFLCIVTTIFLMVFVGFPLVFMNLVSLQRVLIFTHFNLPSETEFFETFRLPAFRNKYVTVRDLDGKTNQTLGVWHMLPVELAFKALHDEGFDYEEALLNSDYSVMIYFHGTGEDRSDNIQEYKLFRRYFHVIAFDYRSYGDSSVGRLSEDEVVNDCVQLYKWVLNQTNSPIYIWGHSLGAALATRTVTELENVNIHSKGLILESAFTSLHDELYVHPYGKIFAWLPWFEATILNPLYRNGFIFNTARNILNVSCPIMILHSEDDEIVPYQFGEKLYEIASNRSEVSHNATFFYLFEKKLKYRHYFMYEDPFLNYYLMLDNKHPFFLQSTKTESLWSVDILKHIYSVCPLKWNHPVRPVILERHGRFSILIPIVIEIATQFKKKQLPTSQTGFLISTCI